MALFKTIQSEQKLTEKEKEIKALVAVVTKQEREVFDTFKNTKNPQAQSTCIAQLSVYQQIKLAVNESLNVKIVATDYYAKALYMLNNPPTLRR